MAVGAFRQVARFFRPYFAPYRTSLLFLALGVAIETAYNTAFPLCLKYLIDEAIGEQDHEVLVWILTIMGGMWGVVVLACGLTAGLGFFFADATGAVGGRAAAFAAGGLLAMMTNSLMPFAFERGGSLAGIATVVGFAVALAST